MANKNKKHPKNIGGPWYCTDPEEETGQGCIACSLCYSGAPEFFAEDEMGNAFVKKLPTSPSDIDLCEQQKESCPVGSIGSDGD